MVNNGHQKTQNTKDESVVEEVINFSRLLRKMASYWYLFALSITFFLVCSFLYFKFSIPTYRVSATLLIDEEKDETIIGDGQMLEGFRLSNRSVNLDNQIMILSSGTLIEKALNELSFDNEYYLKGFLNTTSLYPTGHSIKIVPENNSSIPKEAEVKFMYNGNDRFNVFSKFKNNFKIDTQVVVGSRIITPLGSFQILKEEKDSTSHKRKQVFYYKLHDLNKLVEHYTKRLKVIQVSKTGTIVRLSLDGTNKAKDIDFLNKLIEIFLSNSLDKKNLEAVRTIAFIDDQLIGISDSLFITENKLQEFRSKNRVMNLSSQGQVIIDQAMRLENEKAKIEIEANYYKYLAEYLLKDNIGEVPIAPATMGISDPGLTNLVQDLTNLQSQLYSKSLGSKNPLQNQLILRVRNTKEALKETLNGVMRANNLAKEENIAQIHNINAQATALPFTERQLLGIERRFKLNDELYTFLLERRAVAQIQKASNLPDNEIIDSTRAEVNAVKPQKILLIVLSLFLGISLPFFWILFTDSLNNKLKGIDEIKGITDIPIMGLIPHNVFKKVNIVLNEPSSMITEAFRMLRTRLSFFIKNIKSPVILLSSSIQNEGKTFTTINLASAYSISGKRTVIVDFDLRNSSIHEALDVRNSCGVTTWLSGKDELRNIILESNYENLYILPSGPPLANASELVTIEKIEELLRILKEDYDFILIDSAPVGEFSESFILSALADTTIIIVRYNETIKSQLKYSLSNLELSGTNKAGIIINDFLQDRKNLSNNLI